MWNKILVPVCVAALIFSMPPAYAAEVAVAAAPKPKAASAVIVLPVPETNPYSLLLIALGMLGFTARRERNEIFSDNP